jgi:hypothetical protein
VEWKAAIMGWIWTGKVMIMVNLAAKRLTIKINMEFFLLENITRIFAVVISSWLCGGVPVLVLSHIRSSGGTLSWQPHVGT